MVSDDCDAMDGANDEESNAVEASEVSDRAASCKREGHSERSSSWWMISLATRRWNVTLVARGGGSGGGRLRAGSEYTGRCFGAWATLPATDCARRIGVVWRIVAAILSSASAEMSGSSA